MALRLARATVEGAGELLYQSPLDAATLRQNVTSPKGTTAEALDVLMAENDGLTELLTRAVASAGGVSGDGGMPPSNRARSGERAQLHVSRRGAKTRGGQSSVAARAIAKPREDDSSVRLWHSSNHRNPSLDYPALKVAFVRPPFQCSPMN